MEYSEVFRRLNFETAMVVFIKRNGKVRLMLCSRNPRTAMLGGADHLGAAISAHDKKNSIHNGNISAIDLALDEIRAFNIDRVVSLEWFGEINTKEEYDKLMGEFLQYSKEYNANGPQSISMDMLTSAES